MLPGPTFGFETLSAGLVTIDATGREVMHISRANGLPSDTVYYAMRDQEGALWLGLDNGVTRVETPSPVSYFNQSDGLASAAFFGRAHRRPPVLGLQSGAAFLDPDLGPDGTIPGHFEYIAGTGNQCWGFAKMTDPAGRTDRPCSSRAATASSRSRNDKAIPIKKTARPELPAECHPRGLETGPDAVWLGLFDGLASFRWIARALDRRRARRRRRRSRSVRCSRSRTDRYGPALAATGSLHITPAARPARGAARPATHVERFGTNDGLPVGGVFVNDVKGAPIFSAGVQDPHLLRFDAKTRRFVRETAFDHVVGVNYYRQRRLRASPTRWGRVFLNHGRETAMLQRKPDGTWTSTRRCSPGSAARRSAGSLPTATIAWLQFSDGRLVRYDTSRRMEAPPPGRC